MHRRRVLEGVRGHDTVVMVRAGDALFAVVTSFARLPVPGEHVLLWIADAQRAQLGAQFGFGILRLCVPAIVRESVLHQKDQWRKNLSTGIGPARAMEEHVADLFVEAITTEAWQAKMAHWAAGGGEP